MRSIFICIIVMNITLAGLEAQVISDWEIPDLPENSFVKNSGDELGFESNGVFVPNIFVEDPNFSYWNGWILSSGNDTETPGFMNEHSAIPGVGAENSEQYIVSYIVDRSIIKFSDYDNEREWKGLYVTNSTYAYLSMLNGDGFAKKFGGESGQDPDYFRLTIKGYKDGNLLSDSIDFFLADFSFDDPNEDYIVDQWIAIDLNALKYADSLALFLDSSDRSVFGVNTPAYICVDQITYDEVSSVNVHEEKSGHQDLVIINDIFSIDCQENQDFGIFDMFGRKLWHCDVSTGTNEIDLGFLEQGLYVYFFGDEKGFILKQ